jgi:energy-coupling factor transporter transmembrane protein EcfT
VTVSARQYGLQGAGSGALRRVAPPVRLLVGGMLVLATVAVAVGAARPPLRLLGLRLLAGSIMLLPVFLLAPWSAAAEPGEVLPMIEPIAAPYRVFTTGMAVLAVSLAGTSVLAQTDLREALARLPVPRLLSAITLMVAFQVGALLREVEGMVTALRARGLSQSWRSRLALAWSLPGSWLPRLLARSERIGDAMVVRGYDGTPTALRDAATSPRDLLVLALAVVWLGLVLAVRLEVW